MWILAFVGCHRVAFDLDVDLFPPSGEPPVLVAPSPFEVSLYDERPDAYVPAFLDLEAFGPVLLADRVRRAQDDGFLSVEVSGVTLDVDAPLELLFTVSSADGRHHLLGGESGDASLPECRLVVDAGSAPADQATQLLACLRAYADRIGGPADFFLTVAATTTDDDWEYHATYTLGTTRPTEVACTGALIVTDELREQAGTVDIRLEELSIAGYAASVDAPCSVVAFANTWAEDGAPAIAGASGTARIDAGEGRFVGDRVEVGPEVPASIRFAKDVAPVTTWPATWARTAMDALLRDGFIDTCDVRVHDATPNETFLEMALVGSGEAVR